MRADDVRERLLSLRFEPSRDRPSLLVDAAALPALRERAAATGLTGRLRSLCDPLLREPPHRVNELQPYVSGADAVRVAELYALTGERETGRWVKRRLDRLLALPTWFSPVHQGVCRVCDHVMANVAAQVALCCDLLGDAVSDDDRQAVGDALVRLHFDPYLAGTGDQPEWWYRDDSITNWTIMTCGDTGLALCAFADAWPGAPEALARSARGVLTMLDALPPEGDWPEGVGYWFGTLHLGLRFARALRRLTGGAVNLFEHPILQTTGDFLALLATPGGRVYNFNDCDPALSGGLREALALLAVETGRGDWMGVARQGEAASMLHLACDDLSVASEPVNRVSALFPTTGVAVLRSDPGPDQLFVGFKSGPSAVGHSHLDANSFVLEARGRRLVGEYAYWPQAHFLGFFDQTGPRWNFDGPATIGHSTVLIDGQGQTWGPDHGGRIRAFCDEADHALVVGEAGPAYPGRLRQFTRTVLLLRPNTVVVRDVIVCEGERRAEWLLHAEGGVRSNGAVSVVENEGVRLCVTPLLPDRALGWRTSDVVRTSVYECSDTREEVERTIRYRAFSPFRPAERFEFLFGFRVDGAESGADWSFEGEAGAWSLRIEGFPGRVVPDGDGLRVSGAPGRA